MAAAGRAVRGRAYAADLAHIHHVGFTDFARDAAPALLRLLRVRRIHGLVVDLGCLNYAIDPRAGSPALARLFRRVHAALAPGGLFVFDVLAPGQLAPGAVRHVHREGADWATLVETTESAGRGLLIRRITSFRRVGTRWRRSREIHRLRLYDRASVRRALRRAGFTVTELRGYGRRAPLPRHAVFLATRR